MRVLALHEISNGICGGGGYDALGPTPATFGCENTEGMHVAAAAVGSVAHAVGYMAGSSIIGDVDRKGIVNGLAFGWMFPFAVDGFLRGAESKPRLARAAFIGVTAGLISSTAPDKKAS